MGPREEAAWGGEEKIHGTPRHSEGSQGQKRVKDNGL